MCCRVARVVFPTASTASRSCLQRRRNSFCFSYWCMHGTDSPRGRSSRALPCAPRVRPPQLQCAWGAGWGVSCARARRTRCVGSGSGYFGVASHQPATDSGSWVRRGPDVRGVAARHGTRRVRGGKKGWRGGKHGCVGTMPFELVMIRWSTGWTRPIRPRLGQCRRAGAGAGVGTDVVVRGRAEVVARRRVKGLLRTQGIIHRFFRPAQCDALMLLPGLGSSMLIVAGVRHVCVCV